MNPAVNVKNTNAPISKHRKIMSDPCTFWANIVWANENDGRSEAYVPGKKLLLGAMTMHQLIWCGSFGKFYPMKNAFVKSKGKKSWNPLQWLSSHSWDEALDEALYPFTFKFDSEKKRRLQTLLRKAYEFVPPSEKTSHGKDAFFVYKKVVELGSSVIGINGMTYRSMLDLVSFTMGSTFPSSFSHITDLSYHQKLDSSTVLAVAVSAISKTHFADFGCAVFRSAFEAFTLNYQVMMIIIFQYLSTIMNAKEGFVGFEKDFRRDLDHIYTELNEIAQNLSFIDQIGKVLINDILLHDILHASCKQFTDHGRPMLHAVFKTVKEIYAHFNEKNV